MALKDLFNRVPTGQEEDDGVPAGAHGVVPTEATARIGELVPRQPATVVGHVSSVHVIPAKDGSAWLEASLEDGTGTMTIVWTGRERIPGIRPGARLVATGRPLTATRSGRPTLYNPEYELLV